MRKDIVQVLLLLMVLGVMWLVHDDVFEEEFKEPPSSDTKVDVIRGGFLLPEPQEGRRYL